MQAGERVTIILKVYFFMAIKLLKNNYKSLFKTFMAKYSALHTKMIHVICIIFTLHYNGVNKPEY